MNRFAVAVGCACLLSFAVPAPQTSAAPLIPLSKSAIAALGGDVVDAAWTRCWRDRWGRRVCQRCWRDRWGRVICR